MADAATQLGALAAFTASATWAFASVHYAEAAREVGPVRVNLLRALCAAALWLLALGALQGWHGLAEISARQGALLAASIACSYAFGDSIFFAAARRIGVSAALAIATVYPVWAALYGTWARDEPFGVRRAVGIACCLLGVSALLQLSRTNASEPGQRRAAGLGVALALLTSLCWAGNAVFLKLGAEGLTSYQANALRFGCGAILLLAQLWYLDARTGNETPERRVRAASSRDRGILPLLKRLALPLLADTGLGSVCFVYGISRTDLALGATLSSLSPLVALPIAAARGTERVTAARAMAVALTVAGVVLLVLDPKA